MVEPPAPHCATSCMESASTCIRVLVAFAAAPASLRSQRGQSNQQDQQDAARVRDLGNNDLPVTPQPSPAARRPASGSLTAPGGSRSLLARLSSAGLNSRALLPGAQVGPFEHWEAVRCFLGGGKVVVQGPTFLPLETAPAPRTTSHACAVSGPPP